MVLKEVTYEVALLKKKSLSWELAQGRANCSYQ